MAYQSSIHTQQRASAIAVACILFLLLHGFLLFVWDNLGLGLGLAAAAVVYCALSYHSYCVCY